jgi:endonuclease YncB( thermonuclease family)
MPNIVGIFLLSCMLNIFSIHDNTYASSVTESYTLLRVVDGDTLVVATEKGEKISVRLYGIDCPEGRQNFGVAAKQAVHDLTHNQTLKLDLLYQDRYGRSVAIVWLPDNTTLQERLLITGAGWVFTRYCVRSECAAWERLEHTARALKIGLWEAEHPIPPWEWRKESRK